MDKTYEYIENNIDLNNSTNDHIQKQYYTPIQYPNNLNLGGKSENNLIQSKRKINRQDAHNKAYNKTKSANTSNSSYSNGVATTLRQINIELFLKFVNYLYSKFQEEYEFTNAYFNDLMNINNISTNKCDDQRIKIIKYIINFDCFTLFNKKTTPNYQKPDKIIQRIKELLDVLKQMKDILSNESPSRLLIFFDESECIKCFQKIFNKVLFKREYFRKICSEMWKFLRNNKFNGFPSPNMQIAFERLKLFLYGISLPTSHIEDYPLHQAIFECNLPLIRRLTTNEDYNTFYCHIEESDPIGTTPLMLAVRLGKKDAVLILVENGADPKHRTCPYARTAIEEAVQMKHRSIVRTLVAAEWHIKKLIWDTNKSHILNHLETIPDFSFDMNWECDSSFIPFIKKYAPSDKYKIYKRGSNLRIDMVLVNFTKTKYFRNNMSIILKGKGDNSGKLLLVDNIERKVLDLLSEVDISTLEQQVDDLLKQEGYSSEMRAENVDFQPAENWKGDKVLQKIENYTTIKYNAKGTFSLLYTKKNILVSIDVLKFKTFEQYFLYTTKNSLFVFDDELSANHENGNQITTSESPITNLISYMDYHQNLVASLFNKDSAMNKSQQETSISEKTKEKFERLSANEKKLCKHYKKNIVACVWLCENFPITFEHLLPILDILSNASLNISKLKSFLERKSLLKLNSFPMKAVIPLFFYLNAVIEFKNFAFQTPEAKLFEINQILRENVDSFKDFIPETQSNPRAKYTINENGSITKRKKLRESYLKENNIIKDNNNELDYGSPFHPKKSLFLQNFDDDSGHFNDHSEKLFASFFKKKGQGSIVNQDFVNIFDDNNSISENNNDDDDNNTNINANNNNHDGDDDDENFIMDSDISEKYIFETLKLSNHQSTQPKTIAYIMNKYTPKNYLIHDQQKHFIIPYQPNYHPHNIINQYQNTKTNNTNNKSNNMPIIIEQNTYSNNNITNIKEISIGNSIDQDNSVMHEVSISDQYMKKLMKYNLKKHTLLSKGNLNIEVIKQANNKKDEFREYRSSRKNSLTNYERIKSLDFITNSTNHTKQ